MTLNICRAVKGPLSVQLCYCSCSCCASSSSCSAGPVWTSNRGKDLPKGFRAESWLNVWFLVFLCVEMCLVWSWFGLWFIYSFYYYFLSWLHLFLNLHVGVTATCSAGLLVCSFELLFWDFYVLLQVLKYTNAQNTQGPPTSLCPPTPLSSTQSLSPTHPNTLGHAQNLTSDPLAPHDSLSLLCCHSAASLTDWLSCFLTVTESQWAGKERWQ